MNLAKTLHHGGGSEMTTGDMIGLAVYIAMWAVTWIAAAIVIIRRDPDFGRGDAFMLGPLIGMVWPALPIIGAAWWVFVKLTTTKEKQP